MRFGDETTPDLASSLHRRVDAWLHTQVEDPTTIPVRTYPGHLPPATRETLREVDDLIALALAVGVLTSPTARPVR